MKLQRAYLFCSVLLLLLPATFAGGSSADKWVVVRSRNFEVYSDAGDRQARDLATSLEQFRYVVSVLFSKAKIETPERTKVMLFRDHNSFYPFKPKYKGKIRENVAGYFTGDGDQSLIALTMAAGRDRTLDVIFHEYEHFIVGRNLRNVPLWLNEGLAEYYSTFETRENGRQVALGNPVGHHVALLRAKPPLPFKTLLEVDAKSPDYNEAGKAGIFYAQSWAFVHYLLLGNQGKRRDQLTQFIKLLPQEGTLEEKFQKAFQTDYNGMEQELIRYITNFTFPMVLYTFPQQLETAKDAEGASLTESEVEYHLGDLLLRTRRYEEAEKRIQRALQLDAGCAECRIGLGAIRLHQYRFEESKALLQEGVNAKAGSWRGRVQFGNLLLETGLVEEALASYQQALTANPGVGGVYVGMSCAYRTLGRSKEEEDALRQAILRGSSLPSLYRTRAYQFLRMGRGRLAAEDALAYIGLQGWQDDSAVYCGLAAYFGYLMDGARSEAEAMAKSLAEHGSATAWPAPVIKYLGGGLPEQKLIAAASNNDELTEARCYVGLHLSREGKRAEAIPHLRWVREKGNPSFFEYGLAVAELYRLERGK